MASENYLVKITLTNIKHPVVTRTLSVPKDTTFHKLHLAIQVAFGWCNCHLYNFTVLEPLPPARRRMSYPRIILTLEEQPELNEWTEPAPLKSSRVKLQQVLDNPRYAGNPMEYLYDFGDNCDHKIEMIGTETVNGTIRCVAGKGHGVAEDVGSVPGWERLKSIYRKVLGVPDREAAIKKLPKDEQDSIEWYEDSCTNGDSSGLDPDQ
ncbi:unnamed protein product [Calypogeia fissa]